jgi:hypothetical protein
MHVRALRPLAARVALVAVMAAAGTSSAWSQTRGTLTPESLGIVSGARARLMIPEYGEARQVGTVIAVRGDSIVFRRDAAGDTLIVGFTHVAKLDLSRGRHPRPISGLAIGFVSGAAAGAIVFAASTPKAIPCNGQTLFCGRFFGAGAYAAFGAVTGGLGGALLGTVIGAVVHTERWRTVSINRLLHDPQAGIALIPSQSGPRLALRLAARF